MTNPVFGKVLVARTLERNCATVLQTWFPTYLKQLEIDEGLDPGTMRVPGEGSYANRNSFDDILAQDLPRIVIISPGIVGTPSKRQKHQYSAIWRLGVGIGWSDEDEDLAKYKCDIYGAAVRKMVVDKGGLVIGGRINWIDEQYIDIPVSNQIAQARAANVWFSVDVEDVVTAKPGPDAPDAAPYTYPEVETVDIVLNKE